MARISGESLYELEASELWGRIERARELLRVARGRVSGNRLSRAARLDALDDVFGAVDRLLPGIADRPRPVLARVIHDLSRDERALLRRAIDSERAARLRLHRVLGPVSPSQAEDALMRVEAQESIGAELATLFALFGQSLAAGTHS